jgi:hypothetical protein
VRRKVGIGQDLVKRRTERGVIWKAGIGQNITCRGGLELVRQSEKGWRGLVRIVSPTTALTT